mgnify:CR=1 FL=1
MRPLSLASFAIGLLSGSILMFELALIRIFSFILWHHFAFMVISIALLGFGVSGTILLLVQRFSSLTPPVLRHLSLLGLALSIPLSLGLGQAVNLDLIQMVWQPTQVLRIGLLEMAFTLPFIFSGMYIGLALQDDPARIPGHYGASFIGSGLGGILGGDLAGPDHQRSARSAPGRIRRPDHRQFHGLARLGADGDIGRQGFIPFLDSGQTVGAGAQEIVAF